MILSADTWPALDMLPNWLPDGRILFLRLSKLNGELQPPQIYTIQPDGSDLTQLGQLSIREPYAVYDLDVNANQLVYDYVGAGGNNGNNGVWISNLDGI